MQTIKLIGHVDENHRLTAEVPATVAAGRVEILVVLSAEAEDDAGQAWMAGIAREWAAELSGPRENIYSMTDGEPVNDPR